jgi:MFS family permease
MYRYGFDARTVGLTMAGVGVAAVVVQGFVTGRAVKRFGERTTLIGGLAFGVAGFLVFALAPTGPAFWCGIPLMALWGLANPSAQGLMSRRIGPQGQGELQGANASLMGVANLIGPGLFTLTFSFAIGATAAWGIRARRSGWPRSCLRARSWWRPRPREVALPRAAGTQPVFRHVPQPYSGLRNDISRRVGKS